MRRLTDRTVLAKGPAAVAAIRAKNEERFDVPAERAKMGAWLADYLDDAGYEQWMRNPEVFKAIFVSTFPPNAPLDGQKLRVDTAEDYEQWCVNWLRTADQHIGSTRGDLHSLSAMASMPNPAGL